MTMHSKIEWLTHRPIAHRGLHDEARGLCENSLSAFRAAIAHNFAIECDIRLSADGVPFVFHDETLSRMTGKPGRLSEYRAGELSAMRLKHCEDTIPTLAELLDLVAGQVPLVVELKGTDPSSDSGFADALLPLLDSYEGPIALMSFAPWLVLAAAELGERYPIGLTAEGTRAEHLDRHRQIFERNCSFVSYNVHHLPNSFVSWVREEQRLPVICWTVRTPDDAEQSVRHADQITFEGFTPRV